MHPLQAPAVLDEADGQPVEQLGMSRPRALRAEVIGSRDNTSSKMILPNAIDDHARRQRIVRPGQPARERKTAARMRRASRLIGNAKGTLWIVENVRNTGLDGFARILVVAAHEHARNRVGRYIPGGPD